MPDGLEPRPAYAVGLCGGSGAAYGLRLVEALLEAGARVHLVATPAGREVLRQEAGVEGLRVAADLGRLVRAELREGLVVHEHTAVEAAPSSGSAGIRAVVLCPCSMGTLARVAHGFSSNLVERMADVALKEGRTLIVVPRETPLSKLHLRNMLALAEAGAVVLPAMPGFYHRPQTVAELVDFVVGKILDRLGVASRVVKRWETPKPASPWDEGET
jgi:4-hydroxy-3-polyprenylbenzoate decarboxylase